MNKKAMTHVGTVRFCHRGKPYGRPEFIKLRETEKRWYDEHDDWWPKWSPTRRAVKRNTFRSAYEPDYQPKLYLDLTTIRPFTVVELREPLLRAVVTDQLRLDKLQRSLEKTTLALAKFDRAHPEEHPEVTK